MVLFGCGNTRCHLVGMHSIVASGMATAFLGWQWQAGIVSD